jgi:RNA polymerase sigma-70 factor (ECF subfamily)
MLDPVTAVQTLHTSGAPAGRPVSADQPPDLILVERSRAQDPEAIEALIRRHGGRLYRVARSVLLTAERAQAVVEQAWLTAFADLGRYDLSGKFAPWLTRLTYSEARTQHATLPAVAAGAPAAAAQLHTAASELECAVDALPEVFRTVFVLRVIEGLSGTETAASLGVHETTVRTRLYRALRRVSAEVVERARSTPELFTLSEAATVRIIERVLAQPQDPTLRSISPPL